MGNDGKSPSSRRAWIEIANKEKAMVTFNVALLAEGVDRNMEDLAAVKGKSNIVALLAEGVDRNLQGVVVQHGRDGSPSSRRAWIEIRRGQCG